MHGIERPTQLPQPRGYRVYKANRIMTWPAVRSSDFIASATSSSPSRCRDRKIRRRSGETFCCTSCWPSLTSSGNSPFRGRLCPHIFAACRVEREGAVERLIVERKQALKSKAINTETRVVLQGSRPTVWSRPDHKKGEADPREQRRHRRPQRVGGDAQGRA